MSPKLRRAIAYAIPLAVIAGIGIAMLLGPLYSPWSAAECYRAYDRARTRGDTARVDLHTYHVESGDVSVRHNCGEIRGARPAEISTLLPAQSQPPR